MTGKIKQSLSFLEPQRLEITDDSMKHVGHGAEGGHYTVMIVSSHFVGKSAAARHRMLYQALAGLMKKEIHALSIRAHTPQEFSTL